jgi:glutaredoxin
MVSLLLLQPVSAEMYQWKDKSGNVIFSDSPPSGVESKEIRPKNDQLFQVPPRAASGPESAGGRESGNTQDSGRRVSDVRVIVYMTDWCPYCKKAREYLKSIGASFVEYNIDTDASKGEEMRRKSGGSKGVPLIDVEGIIIRGYNPEAVRAAIDSRRRG